MVKTQLTKEVYDKLEEELKLLKGKRRTEVAAKLKRAIAQGDISENAEYDEAKDESATVEGRILEIAQKLSNAEIIEYSKDTGGTVKLGSAVTVLRKSDGQQITYRIVLPDDANIEKGLISLESPVGKALLNQRKGDKVSISVPAGTLEFEILEVL